MLGALVAAVSAAFVIPPCTRQRYTALGWAHLAERVKFRLLCHEISNSTTGGHRTYPDSLLQVSGLPVLLASCATDDAISPCNRPETAGSGLKVGREGSMYRPRRRLSRGREVAVGASYTYVEVTGYLRAVTTYESPNMIRAAMSLASSVLGTILPTGRPGGPGRSALLHFRQSLSLIPSL